MIAVVDASVAVKWIVFEEDSSLAVALLHKAELKLAAPDLILVEVAGACVRQANVEKALRADMLHALDEWASLLEDQVVKLFGPTPERLIEAANVAIQLGTPLKDCVYLVLAREMETDLITSDVRFRNRALAVYPRVKLLSEIVSA